MLIIGAKEVENGTISVRDRATDSTTEMKLEEFLAKVGQEIAERV